MSERRGASKALNKTRRKLNNALRGRRYEIEPGTVRGRHDRVLVRTLVRAACTAARSVLRQAGPAIREAARDDRLGPTLRFAVTIPIPGRRSRKRVMTIDFRRKRRPP